MKIKINSLTDFRKALKILYFKGYKWNSGERLTDEILIKRYWKEYTDKLVISTDKNPTGDDVIFYGSIENNMGEIDDNDVERIKITKDNINKLLMIESLEK
jgi:hypothetical protein